MRDKKLIVIGGGVSGLGAARLAVNKGYNTFLSDNNYLDKDVKNSLLNLNVVLNEGGHNISMLNNADLIVKSSQNLKSIKLFML